MTIFHWIQTKYACEYDFNDIIQLAYEIIIQYFRDETDAELEPSQDGLQYRFNPGDNNENFEF